MTSRIVQLLARLIGVALVGISAKILGRDPTPDEAQTIADVAMPLAVALVGAGALVFDLLIHRASTGSVLTPPGDQTPSKAADRSLGRAAPLIALAGLAGLWVSVAPGCATALPSSRAHDDRAETDNSLQNVIYLGPNGWSFVEPGRRSVVEVEAEGAIVSGPDSVMVLELGSNRRLVGTTDFTAGEIKLFGEDGKVIAELKDFTSSASATTLAEAERLKPITEAWRSLDPVRREVVLAELEKVRAAMPTANLLIDALKAALTGVP